MWRFLFLSFRIMKPIPSIVIRLLKLSLAYWVVVVHIFWGMSLFHPSCQIFVYVIVHNIPLLFFWAWRFSGNVPCFIPDIGHLYFLSFFSFLVSLARDLSILLIFPKNRLFVFVVFSIIFLFLTFPFSLLDWTYFALF